MYLLKSHAWSIFQVIKVYTLNKKIKGGWTQKPCTRHFDLILFWSILWKKQSLNKFSIVLFQGSRKWLSRESGIWLFCVKLWMMWQNVYLFIEFFFLTSCQLLRELKKGRAFDGWTEGNLSFAPTYKYENNSEKYYGEDPKVGRRTPAW